MILRCPLCSLDFQGVPYFDNFIIQHGIPFTQEQQVLHKIDTDAVFVCPHCGKYNRIKVEQKIDKEDFRPMLEKRLDNILFGRGRKNEDKISK